MCNIVPSTFLRQQDATFMQDFDRLLNTRHALSEDIEGVVKDILQNVKERGDEAVFSYTKRFDSVSLNRDSVRISNDEIQQAYTQCDSEGLNVLRFSAKRIRDFHEKTVPKDIEYEDSIGVRLGLRWTPLDSAGLYVPGGKASYPSSVLMNAIPAQVAKVRRLVMVVPTPQGYINPYVLAAADIAGIEEIYRIGGVQAIGALAYGTETLKPVVKITGPGNIYVATAKRQVFGTVGIDMVAGPSEIAIVADKHADPHWVALDMLSQAEHDSCAQSLLFTDSQSLALSVQKNIAHILKTLPRRDIAKKSWENFGAIVVVKKLESAVALIDKIAPEHLQLSMQGAEKYAESISNAGAIFLGYFTPEAIGDYVGGTNHILPTARSARYASGLGVMDFMKRTSILKCDENNIKVLGKNTAVFAQLEGLKAHSLSAESRLRQKEM